MTQVVKSALPCLFQVGTCTMAICAKEMNKSFYVVAESFKFARLYPLNQQDVPNQFKVCCCLCNKTVVNNLRTTDIDSATLGPDQGTRIETK